MQPRWKERKKYIQEIAKLHVKIISGFSNYWRFFFYAGSKAGVSNIRLSNIGVSGPLRSPIAASAIIYRAKMPEITS